MIYTCKPAKVSLFDNSKTRYTAAKVKTVTGADAVFNGSLFDMTTYLPCCDVKINGVVLSNDQYTYFGYGWKNGELPHVAHTDDMPSVDNFLSCFWVIHNGAKQQVNDVAPSIGGTRGRTAFGFKADGTMVIICTSDTNGAMKLSQTRDTLFANGCVNGIILDGGGSSQVIAPTETITSTRIVSNFVCVTLDKTDIISTNVNYNGESGENMKVCLDPGHGTNEMNQSPDGTYFEHEFALDMANRIRTHLFRCGVNVKLTREDSSTPSLTARAATANTFGADLFVSLHSNATGGTGWNDTAHGLSVWTYAAGGERDKAANLLITQMSAAGIEMFGAKLYHSGFAVLKYTNMPAYLVEYAFHTCHNDVLLLKSNTHRAKLALATAKAICAYGNVKWVDEPVKQTITYKVQIDLTDETAAEQLTTDLTAKGYKPYITTTEIK